MRISSSLDVNEQRFDELLNLSQNFDMIKRRIVIGGVDALMYMMDGFVKDTIMEKIMEFIMKTEEAQMQSFEDIGQFADVMVPYMEVDLQADVKKLLYFVLSGAIVIMVDGYAKALVIDARTYPVRGIEEPEVDRVLRGARDGFVETLVFNTALIRRRIRDVNLTVELMNVGTSSQTDVAVVYMKNVVDPKTLKAIKQKISAVKVDALNMGQESLQEAIIRSKWYNPFPKVRYTERPDAAAASILEGKIVLLVDNAPTAVILPTALLEFLQETDDYCFPPFTGTYLRIVRLMVFVVTIFLTPTWLLLVENPQFIPEWLSFISVKESYVLPLVVQILILEFAFDGVKMASLNTPSSLSGAFSIVGALILGEYAIKAQWFLPQVLLYTAFASVATYAQTSIELGYAFKFCRIILLILTALFGPWGFLAGILILIVLLATNRGLAGKSYLYPLIPFDGKALKALVVRRKIR